MGNNKKQRAIVVCPGRGTYNRTELGYLQRYHSEHADTLALFDAQRAAEGKPTLASLDTATVFKSKEHLHAQNAAPLIYSCAYFDFLSIDRERYDIVAVTGNSMGWYIALACAGALSAVRGFELVSGMAELTQGANLGGQLIYPLVDSAWQVSNSHAAAVEAAIQDAAAHNDPLYWSIVFGGYAVLAGSHAAIKRALAALPPVEERYPFELPGHSAFHTPLMQQASERGLEQFSTSFFKAPELPLIDGNGRIWHATGTQADALRNYTLTTQVTETYHLSKAIRVGLREFAPDVVLLTGPGSTMGGAVAQVMIEEKWHGLQNKADFIAQQASEPSLLALGIPEQRAQAVSCVP